MCNCYIVLSCLDRVRRKLLSWIYTLLLCRNVSSELSCNADISKLMAFRRVGFSYFANVKKFKHSWNFTFWKYRNVTPMFSLVEKLVKSELSSAKTERRGAGIQKCLHWPHANFFSVYNIFRPLNSHFVRMGGRWKRERTLAAILKNSKMSLVKFCKLVSLQILYSEVLLWKKHIANDSANLMFSSATCCCVFLHIGGFWRI